MYSPAQIFFAKLQLNVPIPKIRISKSMVKGRVLFMHDEADRIERDVMRKKSTKALLIGLYN